MLPQACSSTSSSDYSACSSTSSSDYRAYCTFTSVVSYSNSRNSRRLQHEHQQCRILPCLHCWVQPYHAQLLLHGQHGGMHAVHALPGVRFYCNYWYTYTAKSDNFSQVNKQRWSSGRIRPCHGRDPGSIPGRCSDIFPFFCLASSIRQLFHKHDG